MSDITLGIIGGGQLGSMLAISAKKLNIKTIIYSDDPDAPAQNFCNKFISGDYNNKEKIIEFVNLVNYVTYEFENIPFETLNEINKLKPVLPKPSVNRLIQHRLAEKDFVNNLNIRTTRYASIENKSEIEALEDLLPGILKTTTLGYDGKGQYPINSIEEFNSLKRNSYFKTFEALLSMYKATFTVHFPYQIISGNTSENNIFHYNNKAKWNFSLSSLVDSPQTINAQLSKQEKQLIASNEKKKQEIRSFEKIQRAIKEKNVAYPSMIVIALVIIALYAIFSIRIRK